MYGHLFGRTIVGKAVRESSFYNTDGKKYQIGNAYSSAERKDCFLSVYVDDIRLAGKKQHVNPTWKILMKDVDLGEPTSFLDHVCLACTQRECQISKDIVENYRNMFQSQVSAGATEKLPCSEKFDAKFSAWFNDMEVHTKKCVGRYCELANKTNEQ